MAAGLGFKTFTTGEVLTAADTNGYLMQGILVFASSAARATAITSPQEGQYSYLKDTNALEYYDGAAWVGAPVGDITAVTAGKGLTGGGSSGDVTVSLATTAKGDLVAGSGASTAAVLTVGNNGETLVADSSTSTGLRYQAPVQANPVINSAFQIAQRGTSIAVSGAAYTLDRWMGFRNGAAAGETVSRQATGDTTNLPFIQYCARVQRDSGNTSTAYLSLSQSFESVNSIPFAGKTVTVSYYARRGANFSATSNALVSQIFTGTGTDQTWIGGYTGFTVAVQESKTLTTTWQRFTMTATLGASITELALNFSFDPTGTAGAADFFEVTGVQLEVGSVATPFHTLGGTIQGELAACQRYYIRWQLLVANYNDITIGQVYSTTGVYIWGQLPVEMRTTPTGARSGLCVIVNNQGTRLTGGTYSIYSTSPKNYGVTYTHGSATLTAGQFAVLQINNSTSDYLEFSAEL